MTLYRHFPSKDHLIVSYLERSEEAFRGWFEQALASGGSPVGQLLAVFAAVGELAQRSDCRGCTFQITAAEFPDPRHPAHRIAVRHKRRVRATFRRLAAAEGLRRPDALADQLLMLMDGAWVAARMFRRETPAAHVLDAARAVLAAHRDG
jgi:AcrR family transcriptional regulator